MNEKLSILFPTGSFFPAQNGGPDNTVYWITKALTKRGHQPVIATTDWGLPSGTPTEVWLETNYGEVNYTKNPILYLPWGVLRRVLSKIKQADIVHLSMITYPGSWLTAVINSWFYGKPMVWSSRGDLDPPMLRRSPRKKAFVLWLINNLVNKKKLWFHSTCDAETRYIKHNFGLDAKVIEITNYMELPRKVEVSKEKYFLFIGRIDPKKAIENLIEALAASPLFRKSPFTLRIVGEHHNEYGKKLERQVEESGLAGRVEFLGHRTGVEKEELLAGAWFTFMPSHTENFGIVVTEALAQGTPAVASTGTPWELLETEDAGYWVDNDPDSLTEVIEEILKLSDDRMEELNRNALELASEHFDIHQNIDKWVDAYHQILARN
ncbi:MAG: glycosyltransferase family 4 protein [Bacteroidota bacterium]